VVVVEPHLAVGQDVQAGLLLVEDDRAGGVLVGLGVVGQLEGLEDVAAVELVGEPGRARVGADHGAGEKDGGGHGALRFRFRFRFRFTSPE